MGGTGAGSTTLREGRRYKGEGTGAGKGLNTDERQGRTVTIDKSRLPELIERDVTIATSPEYKEARQNVVKSINSISNLRHRVFVLTFAQTGNAIHSARMAGLSESTGKDWKKSVMKPHPEYYAIMTEIRQLALWDNDISTGWCKRQLKTLAVTAANENTRHNVLKTLLEHLDRHKLLDNLAPEDRTRYIEEITETIGIKRRTTRLIPVPKTQRLDPQKEVKSDADD